MAPRSFSAALRGQARTTSDLVEYQRRVVLNRVCDVAAMFFPDAGRQLAFRDLKAVTRDLGLLLREVAFTERSYTALLLLIWQPTKNCASILLLQAVAARALASPQTSDDERALYIALHGDVLSMFNLMLNCLIDHDQSSSSRGEEHARCALQMALLAVRMDMLAALSGLLTAARNRVCRLRPNDFGMIVNCIELLMKVASSLLRVTSNWVDKLATEQPALLGSRSGAPVSSEDGIAGSGVGSCSVRLATELLGAAAQSSVVEHCFSCVLHTWHVVDAGEEADWPLCGLLKGVGKVTCTVLGLCEACKEDVSAPQLLCSLHTVLSGPCLQYFSAAHVVSQLAAAEKGPVYGLPTAQRQPASIHVGQATTRRRAAPELLEAEGAFAVLCCWYIELSLGRQSHIYLGNFAVHELSLRLLRLATASIALHAEDKNKREAQGLQGRRRQGGGTSSAAAASVAPGAASTAPVLIPVHEQNCSTLGFAALRCAAHSRPWIRGLHAAAEDLTPPQGGTRSGVKTRSEEVPGLRYWEVAVPALHALIDTDRGLNVPRILNPKLLCCAFKLGLPSWQDARLPARPPRELAEPLAAGYLPLLERLMRFPTPNLWKGHAFKLSLLFDDCDQLGWLLAYGEPRQVAALLMTAKKLILQASNGAVSTIVARQGGSPSNQTVSSCGETDPQGFRPEDVVLDLIPLDEMLSSLGGLAGAGRAVGEIPASVGTPLMPMDAAAVDCRKGATCSHLEHWAGVHSGSAANADANIATDAGGPVLEWAPQPTQQLLNMVWLAARLWLPPLAKLALAQLQKLQLLDNKDRRTAVLGLAQNVLIWVPSLAHAYILACDLADHSAGCGAASGSDSTQQQQHHHNQPVQRPVEEKYHAALKAGAEIWREMLLRDMELISLLEWTLRWACRQLGGGKSMESAAVATVEIVLSAFECMRAAFPGHISGPQFQAILTSTAADLSVVGAGRLAGGKQAVHAMLIAAACRAASIVPNQISDPGIPDGRATASQVAGLLLRAAASSPADLEVGFHSCSNPGCCNLTGASEAGLPLRKCDSRPGCAWYCGPECERTHGRVRHPVRCGVAGDQVSGL